MKIIISKVMNRITRAIRSSQCEHKWKKQDGSDLFVVCEVCGEEAVYFGDQPGIYHDE